ncbi:dopey [Ascosphaera apis ARSEF 7405]|uniref:Dopey n=1 Tax=Ascosphaera apis ARSEF 7405 TaxID=392613 RepID=A0A167YZF2_9EURO|nr:dopey [Ascosphaera apis ARSEF 7405]
MSRESGSVVRSDSPATSEASLATSRSRTIDEPFKKDKNYRRYASNIDRALSLFDSALQEWADYISFLSKLLKASEPSSYALLQALQSHPPSLPIVPNRVVVSKRLAQCLNPSLPSGVHQKALEVYGYIFEMLPRDQLSQDITLYLPGIAPTLAFASLSVRPLFLSLFENYILHLNPGAIRPALKAILLSLLPGLEDETSEDFETTLRIVNEFRLLKLGDNGFDGDGTGYFWQTLFLISLTNPGRRAGVLAYLNKYFPRLGGAGAWSSTSTDIEEKREDVEANSRSVTQPEPGLLIRCFAAGLTDPQILIQRSFLDLLVTHLPLHSTLLQNDITAEDMHVLVSAAVSIVMRRDMSLNRRLWSWFLGPEASGGTDKTWDISSAARATFDSESSSSRYFGQYGLKPLVSTIKQMIFSNLDHPSERAKPFRISLSLMDRWEIGALIVPEKFFCPSCEAHSNTRKTARQKLNSTKYSAVLAHSSMASKAA